MLSEVIEFNNRYGLLDGCGSVIVEDVQDS